MNTICAKEWMTKDPITITPDTKLHDAYRTMEKKSIRHLPIVLDGHLLGLATKNAIRHVQLQQAAMYAKSDLANLIEQFDTVGELPNNPLVIVHVDDPILSVIEKMLCRHVTAVPVMHNGSVVGILSESDIYHHLHLRLEEANVVV